MILNILAMISAVAISSVAAYYSIAGLIAIFSGAFWPIVIMGSALEFGKIITTVWLHGNWSKLNTFLKYYMSVAVVVLMFVTSMGIFGFLSRAHIETAATQSDNTLLIKQIDQNISVEQQRIVDNQNIIKQMDDAVNSLLSGSAANATRDNNRTASMAGQATKLRSQQKPERDAANKTIDETNARLQELNNQKLKLEQQQLKVEAEVGPIKYIAQLIYGDAIDKSLLERAVRWVIICIVFVFDPLAVSLVLGVSVSMGKRREEIEEHTTYVDREVIKEVEKIVEVPVERVVTVYNNEAIERAEKLAAEVEELRNREPEVVYQEITQPVPIFRDVVVEKIVEVPTITEVEKIVEVPVETIREVEKIVERTVEVPVETIREVEKIVEVHDNKTIVELTSAIDGLLAELESKNNQIHELQAIIQIDKEEKVGIDETNFTFDISNDIIGPTLPSIASLGRLFILTSQPNNLYKFNGSSWILVDRDSNTSYTQNTNWKNWQLGRLQRAEIEWDDMTPAEQQALEEQFNT
jgi:hypothetical protein